MVANSITVLVIINITVMTFFLCFMTILCQHTIFVAFILHIVHNFYTVIICVISIDSKSVVLGLIWLMAKRQRKGSELCDAG